MGYPFVLVGQAFQPAGITTRKTLRLKSLRISNDSDGPPRMPCVILKSEVMPAFSFSYPGIRAWCGARPFFTVKSLLWGRFV